MIVVEIKQKKRQIAAFATTCLFRDKSLVPKPFYHGDGLRTTNILIRFAEKGFNMKNKNFVIDDGFRAELVRSAEFKGIFEIPYINPPKKIVLPKDTIPFSLIKRSKDYSEFVVFYEHDTKFSDVISATDEYLDKLKKFPGVVSPDCSLYRDMPLTLQIANTYMNRAIGHYLQLHGIYVIPNVRWGDERSYTTSVLPEKFAFAGLPKHSIVSVGTYGCIQGKENKRYFREGLIAMLDELEPEYVLVYGSMPDSIFGALAVRTTFVHYKDWTTKMRGGD